MVYKIKVNQEICIGCGICTSICPDSFEINGDKAYPKKELVDNLDGGEKEAEESCPTQAISIEEIKEG